MRTFLKPQRLVRILMFCTLIVYFLEFFRSNSPTSIWYRSFRVLRLLSNTVHEEDRGIPKIIHQIWNDEAIPEVFQDNIRGLVAHNKPPKWKYFFWTIETGTKLIKKEFPYLLDRYLNAENFLKADILRYPILHKYGGVYFDLDTVSVKPLDPFVESHNCSFVFEPDEHVFYPTQTRKTLLISTSAIFCKPSNCFIKEIIKLLSNQSSSCRDAVHCTGPYFISKHYEYLQGTNKSTELPIIVDHRYFEDMVDPGRHGALRAACNEPSFSRVTQEWAKEICRYWIKRGREKRKISEMAYTYHTWFHTNLSPVKRLKGKFKNIKELVPNVTLYDDVTHA